MVDVAQSPRLRRAAVNAAKHAQHRLRAGMAYQHARQVRREERLQGFVTEHEGGLKFVSRNA